MAQKNLRRRRAPVKKKQKPRPAAMLRRLAKRKAVKNIGTAAVHTLREMRDAGDGPTLSAIGEELRTIARRIKLVESCLIVINMALDGQNVEQDYEISAVLKHVLNHEFFEPIRDLENVAAKCDGGSPSDRNVDDDDEGEAS